MKKFLTVVLIVAAFLIVGCGGEETIDNQNMTIAEKKFATWTDIPARISLSPSIGTTRAEFDGVYRQTNTNGVGYIRYNDDVWHVQFFDDDGELSDDKNARAEMVTVQVLTGIPFEPIQLDYLLPSDATNLQYDDKGSDNMIRVKNVTGTSADIAKIFPASGGKFGGGFNWDAETGNFIGGTIMVNYPLPSKE